MKSRKTRRTPGDPYIATYGAALARNNLHSDWVPRAGLPMPRRSLTNPKLNVASLEAWPLEAERYLRRILAGVELDVKSAVRSIVRDDGCRVTVTHPRLWVALALKLKKSRSIVCLHYGSGVEGLRRVDAGWSACFPAPIERGGGATLLQRLRWLAGIDPEREDLERPREMPQGPPDPESWVRQLLLSQRDSVNLPKTPLYDALVEGAVRSAELLSSIPFYARMTETGGLASWIEYERGKMGYYRERYEDWLTDTTIANLSKDHRWRR